MDARSQEARARRPSGYAPVGMVRCKASIESLLREHGPMRRQVLESRVGLASAPLVRTALRELKAAELVDQVDGLWRTLVGASSAPPPEPAPPPPEPAVVLPVQGEHDALPGRAAGGASRKSWRHLSEAALLAALDRPMTTGDLAAKVARDPTGISRRLRALESRRRVVRAGTQPPGSRQRRAAIWAVAPPAEEVGPTPDQVGSPAPVMAPPAPVMAPPAPVMAPPAPVMAASPGVDLLQEEEACNVERRMAHAILDRCGIPRGLLLYRLAYVEMRLAGAQ